MISLHFLAAIVSVGLLTLIYAAIVAYCSEEII
jgi:hypothetical protein